MTPEERIREAWPDMTRAQQIQLEAAVMGFYTIHKTTGAVMKRRWPLLLLIGTSILYACFSVAFFPQYPEIVFGAGAVLGVIWAAIFINWAYSGGKR